MTKLKGLILTEGMHGMISQAEGLAKVLDLDFIHEKIELGTFWKLLPPKITPIGNFIFKNRFEYDFNIVISSGRKSVIPYIYLKKKFKNKIINIHIQDPKLSLNNFDFIVVPEHDGLIGENGYQDWLEVNSSAILLPDEESSLLETIDSVVNRHKEFKKQQVNKI